MISCWTLETNNQRSQKNCHLPIDRLHLIVAAGHPNINYWSSPVLCIIKPSSPIVRILYRNVAMFRPYNPHRPKLRHIKTNQRKKSSRTTSRPRAAKLCGRAAPGPRRCPWWLFSLVCLCAKVLGDRIIGAVKIRLFNVWIFMFKWTEWRLLYLFISSFWGDDL